MSLLMTELPRWTPWHFFRPKEKNLLHSATLVSPIVESNGLTPGMAFAPLIDSAARWRSYE
jgi:hypothetical protein